MQTEIFAVDGMMCDACVGHVTKALQAVEGVQSVQVSLSDKTAVVTFDPARVQSAQLIEVVDEEGYTATPQ